MVRTTVRRCRATNAAGSPCSAQPIRPDGYCYWHSPNAAADRAEARRRGGASRSNQARARRALPAAMGSDELLATLSEAIRRVERGDMQPGPAGAIAQLARTMNAIRETSEVERRL